MQIQEDIAARKKRERGGWGEGGAAVDIDIAGALARSPSFLRLLSSDLRGRGGGGGPFDLQAPPPFFIFSLLKRQMDKVYCKVGSKTTL